MNDQVSSWWLVLISRSRRDSATTGLGNSGYQSLGARFDGEDQRAAGSFGDEFVEVVGLGGGELAHGEVVEDRARRGG